MLTVEGKKFDWKNIPLNFCVEGNAKDTYGTARVYHKLLQELEERKLGKLYEKLIAPLTMAFRDIEFEGLEIDEGKLEELGVELQDKIVKAERALREAADLDDEINLNSTKDLIKVIFSLERNKETKKYEVLEDFGLGLYPVEFTKKGAPSTNVETLVKVGQMVEEEFLSRGLKVE
jgi:DNA polymerase I-like protein with 3'-5' exonuclease and polymerase domains|tara:strand:+ start:238 stop:765 length:528 start_codon:yes stop_codon:yes gene_type:complete